MLILRSHSFVRKDESSVVSLSFVASWERGEALPLEDSIAVAWVGSNDLDSYDFAPGVRELIELAFAVV
jgi:hypothetical protein